MSESNIYERVLPVVEHNTDNRAQGPTVMSAVVVQLLSRGDHSPNEIKDATATLVEKGDLEATDEDTLKLPDDQ